MFCKLNSEDKDLQIISEIISIIKKGNDFKRDFLSLSNRLQAKELELHHYFAAINNVCSDPQANFQDWCVIHGKSFRIYLNSMIFISSLMIMHNEENTKDSIKNYIEKYNHFFDILKNIEG